MTLGHGDVGFRAAQQGFAAASEAWPRCRCIQMQTFAGRRLEISFVGDALIHAIAPSFAHLQRSPASPDGLPQASSLRLWDCAETGIARPAVPGNAGRVSEGDGWRALTYDEGRYLCEERARSLLWLDRTTGQLVGCMADARSMGCAMRARPLQRMMSVFSRSLGIQEVHAGLVARDGNGVLIVGGGGRGKSTTALDALHGGLDFLGDDSVGIGEDASGMRGYCLYASARVLPRQAARWPRFAGHWLAPDPPELKMLLLPAVLCPERVVPNARIVAIAVTAVTGRGLHVARTSPLDAFHALVHESRDSYRRFGITTTEFYRFAALTKAVPCYRFEVDDDPGRVVEGFHGLLDEAMP